ncbi:N-acetylmuramoyl-L-alanine amidase [Streptomyces tirandamycinicus]|uniref:N-acetylmuramoyl-L-alanine amidase n=1 Tax=Streptomyces tirandamycinicus TaxID=2174846 RepID=UPI00226ED615|nr:N-acetylmuramoyl-L-alanine amidase [Streptomyces tirandamycinicus]MCY0980240.1 N-acetylmuramoyl-L-alanine amidase [Streptomyces tirandamycinicus]
MPYDLNPQPAPQHRPHRLAPRVRDRGGAGPTTAALTVLPAVMALAALTLAGCGGAGGPGAAPAPGNPEGAGATPSTAASGPSPTAGGDGAPAGRDVPAPSLDAKPAGPGGGPLAGKVVVIDPGHNPGNFRHPREISRLVDIGTNRKECDTTGTATDDGYTEAAFNLDVARRLRTLLEKQGATVRFTQDDDRPFGPCVDERARIGNRAAADAAVSIHADGSGSGNRGFHVIHPAPVERGAADTAKIVGPSRELAERIAGQFVRATGSAPAEYVGGGTGLHERGDLGGLNLSTVPKVFVECGNMRDAKDAALLKSSRWRQQAAQGIAEGISTYLRG